jgi:hypothetical protein
LPRVEVCEEYKEDDQLVGVQTTSGNIILFKGEIPKGAEVTVSRLPVYCCCKSTDLRGLACVQGRENHSSTKCMLCNALPYQWADEPCIGDLWNTERIKAELYGSYDDEMDEDDNIIVDRSESHDSHHDSEDNNAMTIEDEDHDGDNDEDDEGEDEEDVDDEEDDSSEYDESSDVSSYESDNDSTSDYKDDASECSAVPKEAAVQKNKHEFEGKLLFEDQSDRPYTTISTYHAWNGKETSRHHRQLST